MSEPRPASVLPIVGACAIAVALIGLLTGMGSAPVVWQAPSPARQPDAVVLPAVPYAQMDGKARGPNAAYRSDLATLQSRVPQVTDPVVNREPDKQETLARRALRRAYNGAPPVIPHRVDANDVTSCYACHGTGKEIDGRIAAKISHPRYTNCTQCHAQAATPGLGSEFPVENTFVGLKAPTTGSRAWPGAPPTIPHSTSMRGDCTSCHGVLGGAGMRSTHPWRVNCLQCHAASAALDQHRFDEPAAPPWAGETMPAR
jgi:cytochrome c-type protein NapB